MTEPTQPKNSIRLGEFEKRIDDLSTKANKIESTVKADTDTIHSLKSNMVNIKTDINSKLNSSNQEISTKIKSQFQTDFNNAEETINQTNSECAQLEKDIEELHRKILEYEAQSNNRILAYRKRLKEYNELKHQYEILKEGYDDAAKENLSLKKNDDERKAKIATLGTEIDDMKVVIAKLTDARIILNKYFSSHYENFTEEEKRLIAQIEGNVFPGHYNNNPVLPDIDPIQVDEAKQNPTTKPRVIGSTSQDSKKSNRYDEQPIKAILNEEEYLEYQQRVKNGNSVQINQGNPKVSQSYTKNYFGPDDDYWYEQNKKK